MGLELQSGGLENCSGILRLEAVVFLQAHAVGEAQAHEGVHDVVHAGRWHGHDEASAGREQAARLAGERGFFPDMLQCRQQDDGVEGAVGKVHRLGKRLGDDPVTVRLARCGEGIESGTGADRGTEFLQELALVTADVEHAGAGFQPRANLAFAPRLEETVNGFHLGWVGLAG